jgi:DNA transformation protein
LKPNIVLARGAVFIVSHLCLFGTKIAPRRQAIESGKGRGGGKICYRAAGPHSDFSGESGMDAHRFDDLFAEFGPIRLRRFFGGEGIYADEVMIALVSKDVIYFHTNAETRAAFLAEGCRPFTFLKRSRNEMIATHWYALPERLYDDPEELAAWAQVALDAMRNSETEKKKRAKAAKRSAKKKKKR